MFKLSCKDSNENKNILNISYTFFMQKAPKLADYKKNRSKHGSYYEGTQERPMRFLEAVSGYDDRNDGEVSGDDVIVAIPVVHSEDEDVRGWAKDWVT